MRRKRVYGHRGAPVELPENTLESFARALEVGADALETDVHLTRDGHVVVAHDPTGARCCGVPDRVDETSLSAMKGWDAGARHPRATGVYRIPTLAEALDAFPEAFFNIDVKPRSDAAVEAVVRLVRAHDARDRVRLASFHVANVRLARRLGHPSTALGLSEVLALVALPARVLALAGPGGDAAQIPVRHGPVHLDGAGLIAKAHALGLRVDYWTIDDPTEAAVLFARGADGVVTNDPRRIVPVAEAYGAP